MQIQSPSPQASDFSHTILIADDIEENLELLADVLGEQGFKVLRASNGVEALEVLHKSPVQMIIADAMMPKMDGFELCKAVRRQASHANTPFVIRTGNYIDKEDMEFAHRIGVDRYMVKEPALGGLLKIVNDLFVERFGSSADRTGSENQPHVGIDDPSFLETHHMMVSKKLEEKMVELEVYAETLKKRNNELQASEARYKSLFEHANVAIFVIDRRTARILDVNRMGTKLLRLTREEVLAMESFPLGENNESLSTLLLGTGYSSGETVINAKTGGTIQVEIVAVPVTQANDLRQILFVRDITEQRKMHQQLMEAEKMMMIGCFATGIAHEIRNPLTAVALNLQYLLHKHGDNPELREYIESAYEATLRVGSVVENTLSLARRTPLVLKPSAINELVQESLRFVRIPLQEKKISIMVNLDSTLPLVSIDEKGVKQALLNLLRNAIEVSPMQSTIGITTSRLPGKDDQSGSRVGIAIEDSGPGIKPEDLPHVFEPLRTTKSGGTGIGLALSKHIMDRHGGEISLEPRSAGGTRAHLIFNTSIALNGGTHVKR